MLYKAKTGIAWRDLPERYRPWKTIYTRFWRWSPDGTLTMLVAKARVIAEAIDKLDRKVSVDFSIVRAHQHAGGVGVRLVYGSFLVRAALAALTVTYWRSTRGARARATAHLPGRVRPWGPQRVGSEQAARSSPAAPVTPIPASPRLRHRSFVEDLADGGMSVHLRCSVHPNSPARGKVRPRSSSFGGEG